MKTRTMIAMTMGLGLMALAASQAQAETPQNCAPRPVVLEQLATGFGETRQGIGLGAQGVVIEVFASARTGTWTIIATMPDGITCLIAAGENYEALAEAPPPPGNDA
jgi:hypothetical protein